MLQLTIIGHLGADAEVKTSNGNKFVSFRVAHSESFKAADGTKRERTQWVSCALNGDGGELLQYLTKGQQVCVVGNMTLGIASSQIQRAMVATCNVHVRSIELVGSSNSDSVPKQLADETGYLHNVLKLYTVSTDSWKALNVPPTGKTLYDTRGGAYVIDKNGIITKLNSPSNDTVNDSNNADAAGQQG